MLKSILSTTTFRQSLVTITGTILNGVLGALFYIVLVRFLVPSDFGLLIISLTTSVLIVDIADIGTNTGLIRFVSSNLITNKEKASRFLKLGPEIKLMTWAVSFLVIFFLSPILSTQIFHKEEVILPLPFVAFGVGGVLLFTFVISMLRAYQKCFLCRYILVLYIILSGRTFLYGFRWDI
ncbi:MAG: oligosaccharide flippase family protein [bacterium]|nr:oligosaccharide flippase family protein [bacterium]